MMKQCKFKWTTTKGIMVILFCLFSTISFAQQTPVSGKVTDSKGETLPGVTIVEKGTPNGTITSVDGTYTITVSAKATLVFSFVGMKTKEKAVNGEETIDVQLLEENVGLEQVVVTGYQTQRKADLTGAVSVVEVGELQEMPNNNISQSLQGRVAGVTISTDGSPSGSNTTIRIRGIGTLNDNDPLYVIDGVPTKAGMHELNPNDIESIQVLKDASSASIYGSRAANGVIVVTTKKAKKGQLKVNLNLRNSISWYSTKMDVLDTKQYGEAFFRAKVNDGLDPNSNSIRYTFDWNEDYSNPVLNQILIPEYLDDDKTLKPADTDWFDEISHLGYYQTYDLSIQNGTERGSSMLSLGYTDNDGIIKTTNFKRYSVRLNTDYNLFDKALVIGENLSINKTREIQDPGVLNLALQALPIIPVHTVDGDGWGGPVGGMNDRQNPVRLLEDNKQNHYDYLRILGNLYATLNITKNLNFRTNFGVDYGSYYKRDMQLTYQSGYLSNETNSVECVQTYSKKFVWSNTLNYKFTKNKHDLNVLAGTEMFREKEESFSAYGEEFDSEDKNYMYLDATTGTQTVGGYGSEYKLLSFFGKANYVYNEKYLASVTLRYDGSSRFGKNNRYGTFPAFSLGWRLSNENFIKDNLKSLSNLKLRFGWGQTGNQEIDNNATKTIYVTNYSGVNPTWTMYDGTAYDITGANSGTLASGYQMTQRGNDDLKWETTTQSNIGLDFGFLDQKIYGSAEYYIKKTKDILICPSYIAVIGEGGSHWVNGASMQNKGVEILMGVRGNIISGLKFDISGNISGYRNKVTKLPEEVIDSYGGDGQGDNILGRPINSAYGYVADGIFKTQSDLDNHADQTGKGLGRIRYRDLDNSGTITTADKTWIKNPHPDFIYGLNMNFSYKNFDLSLFFQGVGKVDVENVQKYSTDFWSVSETGSNKGTRLLNAWSASNPDSDIPALTSINSNDEGRFSTYFIEDGAYLKLRNAQIGYTLPRAIAEKLKISNFRIYVSGQNLFTIKSKSFTGVDPESTEYGYPIPTMLTTGVNVSF